MISFLVQVSFLFFGLLQDDVADLSISNLYNDLLVISFSILLQLSDYNDVMY